MIHCFVFFVGRLGLMSGLFYLQLSCKNKYLELCTFFV